MSRKVKASFFSDRIGAYDNNLFDGGLYYAELSKDYKRKDFSALGKLSPYHKLKITYKGKSEIAKKGDVGAGGPNHPAIDLHIVLANKLGFDKEKGIDTVTIEDAE